MSVSITNSIPPHQPTATVTAQVDTTKNAEPLAVRVMRLSKPTLYQNIPVYAEEESSSSAAAFLAGQSHDIAIGNDHSVLSHLLVLPYSFGNVFLGEIFSAIVSLHNQSDQVLRDVILKTDIQTATQRIVLNSNDQNDSNKMELVPDQSICRVLQHEVKELGNHSLVCTVTCTDQNGEKCNLKKVFKLPVGKPIDLKTRFIPGAKHDEYYVVADIQNQTPSILNMITVELEPSNTYTVKNLSYLHHENSDHSESSLCEAWRFIRSNEITAYMFYLKPRTDITFEQLHSTPTLGKLDIVWMSGLGERGRLQTNQLPKPTPPIVTTNLGYLPDLRLFLIRGQGKCFAEEAQTFSVRILNCTQRTMDLSLSFDNSFAKREQYIWIGVISKQLGKLEAHHTYDIELQLVPLTCGMKRIGGLRLTDLTMRHTYDLEDFHHLFVLPKLVH
ncbi:unnamed protein product [Rotaria socialis]|uniref:Trafficking protein particle complex subunit 13 n=3 Tax=Rotaria socialis TaxID=392032 RepID=A0A817P2I9_9BILA|nr:unnamed protein product [Rotaria socialis]CAF3347694.1 unnamed protein product [Rotaria socialis]CAF3351572.1 unnamed protein product [Rotaria socialis]CAF3444020.1 unnamed protein product [Rotaria socialis]CAF3564018.1 unnamed protein product [Rotaria socialis]